MTTRNYLNKMAGIGVLMIGLAISSCKKDFLDLRPYDSIGSDVAISNVSDMKAALSGAYANLGSVNLYGRTIPLFGDLLADNVYISTINSNRYLDFFQVNYTVTNSNAQGVWQSAYSTILRANNVINSPLKGTEDIEQVRGEALSIRALMYFELARHFAQPYTVNPNGLGVPIIVEYNPSLKPPRNTLKEVYAQIETDLNKAIGLLTIDKSSGFFTKYAAKALMARISEYKVDSPNA